MQNNKNLSRRNFLGKAALASVAGATLLSACDRQKTLGPLRLPPLLERAPQGETLKAALVGCGHRGTGAALNYLKVDKNVEIVALADLFPDRLQSCRKRLQEIGGQEIADEKCFLGLEAYQQAIESDADIIILATPPYFRPQHFEACVEAGKHVFMEKPIAVDPTGVRKVLETAKKAREKGLSAVAGTQYRHGRDYIEVYKRVRKGTIGNLVAANSYYLTNKLWHVAPRPDRSELENMIRNWVNWTWLSGDHIVEQHIHNLDVINWFMDSHPEKATGLGSRQRRITGDQYDHFSVDFIYPNGMHLHSMCRQINGCTNNVSDSIQGTNGSTNCRNTIYAPDGSIIYQYKDYPINEKGKKSRWPRINPYIQEHIDLVTSIRNKKPLITADTCAYSTMTGIMGRISAYTGKEITWDEMMNSELMLGPKKHLTWNYQQKPEIQLPGTL